MNQFCYNRKLNIHSKIRKCIVEECYVGNGLRKVFKIHIKINVYELKIFLANYGKVIINNKLFYTCNYECDFKENKINIILASYNSYYGNEQV